MSFRDELDESGEHRRSPGADGVGADLARIGKELAAEREVGQWVMRLEFELELKEGRGLWTDAGRGERLRHFGAKLFFGIFRPKDQVHGFWFPMANGGRLSRPGQPAGAGFMSLPKTQERSCARGDLGLMGTVILAIMKNFTRRDLLKTTAFTGAA